MLTTPTNPVNLGSIEFGQPYHFAIPLQNLTDKPIEITKLVIGCQSCTKANMNQIIVEPKQSAPVNVIFTPGSTGIQSKAVTVFYKNGVGEDSLQLNFKAFVPQ